jgi:three-Cys-motif partner protein
LPGKYDRHWEEFPEHTRLKHAILRAYLGAWARILLNRSRHDTIWFVDGFAGRGRDDKGNPGSPLIACAIADEIQTEMANRGIGGRVRIVAVEENPDNFKALERNASDSPCGPILYHNAIYDQYREILRLIGAAPALFFLDPWGVDGLSADMIADMLEGERREVLVLFSEEGTHRLAGAVASEPGTEDTTQASLFADEAPPPVKKVPRTDYRDADEAILEDVFAGLWELVQQTAEHNPGMERESYLESYMAIQERLGAKHVLPMSIVDERDHHHYSLVHASKNGNAIRAMKEALNSAMNKRAKEMGPRPGLLENLHFASPGLARVCDQIAEHFAGETVRWTDKPEKGTVRVYALEETWALVEDLQDIKAILAARDYAAVKKPLTFTFPASRDSASGE